MFDNLNRIVAKASLSLLPIELMPPTDACFLRFGLGRKHNKLHRVTNESNFGFTLISELKCKVA